MRVPPGILYAFIIVLCVVGAFGVRNNIADVYFCLAFGVLGYFMKRFGIPTAPFILAVILGPLAERYFLTSMASYDQDVWIFFTRPISGVIMALALAMLLWGMWPTLVRILHYAGGLTPAGRRSLAGSGRKPAD